MNFKTTLILILILTAAGGYVAWDRTRSVDGPDKPQPRGADDGRLFADIPEGDVTSIVIRPAEADEIVLNRAGNRWRMAKPIDAPAEVNEKLLPELLGLRSTRQVELADTGLDKPSFRIEVSAARGKLLRFAIGKKLPLDNLMYVQVAGKPKADVVPADAFDLLSVPANDLQTKKLIDVDPARVQRVTIAAPGKAPIALERGGGGWVATEPRRMKADAVAVERLLADVLGLKATDFVGQAQVQAMQPSPLAMQRLTVWFDTEGAAAPPASAPATAAATATGTAPAAATTTPAATQPSGVTITFGDYDTARKAKVFAMVTGARTAVKIDAAAMDRLAARTAESVWDRDVLDVDPASVTSVSIVAENVAGAPAGKREVTIARRTADQAAAATSTATTGPSTRHAANTRPTTVAATAPAITTRPATAATTSPASAWVLKSNPAGDADDNTVTALLRAVHPLTVQKYLDAAPAASTAPSPRYTLRFTTVAPGGASVTSHEIKLLDRGGGSGDGPGSDPPVFAEYNGLSFELPRTILTTLEGNFAKKPKSKAGGPNIGPGDIKLPGDR